MRAFAFLIGTALAAAALGNAAAQEGPPGGGPGGGEEAAPGAYASPSAIPEGTVDERFGLPRQGRITFDPIALPDGVGRRLDPEILPPSIPAFAPQMLPNPTVARPEHALVVDARLEEKGDAIPGGLVWRLFSEKVNRDGRLQLMGVVRGPEAMFDVPAGTYILHVGYGRASLTKRIEFSGLRTRETVVLNAGGLRLEASASDGSEAIRSDKLTFDVLSHANEDEEPVLVAANISAEEVLRLNAGTYQVVSKYGAANRAQAEVRVEAGRITSAHFQHHAAEVTMKLVRERGGEAIADTAWSIAPEHGEIISVNTGAFASLVLPEGVYTVIARNRDRIYQREVSVRAGEDMEVELLVAETTLPEVPVEGSGD